MVKKVKKENNEQRTTIELLEILKDYIIKDYDSQGMCMCVWQLEIIGHITEVEEDILDRYLEDNEPENAKTQAYWFPYGDKQPRIDWINEQIEKLKQ